MGKIGAWAEETKAARCQPGNTVYRLPTDPAPSSSLPRTAKAWWWWWWTTLSHICNVPNRNVSSWDPFHRPKTWNNNGEVKLQQDKQDDDDAVETQYNALDDDDDEENTRPTKEHVWWFL